MFQLLFLQINFILIFFLRLTSGKLHHHSNKINIFLDKSFQSANQERRENTLVILYNIISLLLPFNPAPEPEIILIDVSPSLCLSGCFTSSLIFPVCLLIRWSWSHLGWNVYVWTRPSKEPSRTWWMRSETGSGEREKGENNSGHHHARIALVRGGYGYGYSIICEIIKREMCLYDP